MKKYNKLILVLAVILLVFFAGCSMLAMQPIIMPKKLIIEDAVGKRLDARLNINAKEKTAELTLNETPVRKIKFNKIRFKETIGLGIDDVPETGENSEWIEVYAIDPTKLEFENATVTVTAKGNSLYKCKDWNFTEQSCFGNWTLFKTDLVPGQEYTFTLTPEDPGFGEILITKAEHLDENRTFVEDIYDLVKERDNNWTEPIPSGHYIRVTFEQNLTSDRDITLYARSNYTNASIEVYEKDYDVLLASFPEISEDNDYIVYLTNLSESQDTFDLKVDGASVEFDYIVDPTATTFYDNFETDLTKWNDNGATAWDIVTDQKYAGNSSLKASDTNEGDVITDNIDTSNATLINISFWLMDDDLDNADIDLYFYNGSDYNLIADTIDTIEPEDTWHFYSVATTDSQYFKTNFRVRFNANVGSAENYWMDEFTVNITTTAIDNPPTHTTPILNSTSGTNTTDENLTCYNQSTYDPDSDPVKNIFNWYKNGTSINVLNMPFEGGSNSTYTKDYSGYSNDGTVYNAVWNSTGGYDGRGAYGFDGNWDYIIVKNNSVLNSLGSASNPNYTIAFWWKTNPGVTGYNHIISKLGTMPTDPGPSPFELYLTGSSYRISFAVKGASNRLFLNVPNIIYPEKWYFIVGVREENVARLYVNGTEVLNGTTTFGDASNTQQITIGQRGDNSIWANGTIDDVRVYDYALSPEQIKALYNNRTDLIVSNETSLNDVWQCCITPNDGNQDGAELCSNNLTILPPPDTTSPSSVTNLANQSQGTTWIYWNWTNPSDPDFNHTEVWLNGTFYANISAPANFYNATGLAPDTSYEIQTRTADNEGNINATWVNDTAKTLPLPPTTLQTDKTYYGRGEIVNITGVNYTAVAAVTIDIKYPNGTSVSNYPKNITSNAGGDINDTWTIPSDLTFKLGTYTISSNDTNTGMGNQTAIKIVLKPDSVRITDKNQNNADVKNKTNESDNIRANIWSDSSENYMDINWSNNVPNDASISKVDFFIEHYEATGYNLTLQWYNGTGYEDVCIIKDRLGENFDNCSISQINTANKANNISLRITDKDTIGNSDWSYIDFVYLHINFTEGQEQQTGPAIIMTWIDPQSDQEINRQQNQVESTQAESTPISFVQNFFGDIFKFVFG